MRGLLPFVIFVTLMFVALAIVWIATFNALGLTGLFVGCVGFLLFWIIAELVTSILFFTYAKFTHEDGHKDT